LEGERENTNSSKEIRMKDRLLERCKDRGENKSIQ
jgi:hypothetical protein